jgi:hypothetical protein
MIYPSTDTLARVHLSQRPLTILADVDDKGESVAVAVRAEISSFPLNVSERSGIGDDSFLTL